MIDFFVQFFSNPFNIVMVLLFVVIGILIGVVIIRFLPSKNQILYCRERDGRGLELNVEKEDPISLETSTKPPLRFFKWGRSYEFRKRFGRAFTRFFGKEGTGYSWRLFGFSGEKDNPVEANLEFPTLEAAVKHRWGEEFYETVPEERKAELRDDKLLVTVNLEPGITPEGYEPITESVIKKKAREDAAELISRSIKGAIKKTVYDWIFPFAAGAGALAIISKLLGWW